MPSLRVKELGITDYFEEVLGVHLTNPQWSWGGESKTNRTLFFRVWEDQITQDYRKVQVSWPSLKGKQGLNERTRHLDMMRAGRPVFAVICEARKPVLKGKNRKIKNYDKTVFLRLELPLKQDENKILWATIREKLSFSEMMKVSGSEAAIKDDVAEIREKRIPDTTKQMLVDARLGQGQFRRELLALWGGCCAVTGSFTKEALRASHILAWKLSSDSERLDPRNGLPLNAGLDALFDTYLITFSDEGKMIVSHSLPSYEITLLGLDDKKVRQALAPETKVYLARHRTIFEDKESKRTPRLSEMRNARR